MLLDCSCHKLFRSVGRSASDPDWELRDQLSFSAYTARTVTFDPNGFYYRLITHIQDSSIYQQWSSKDRNICEPTSAPAGAEIIACHIQTTGIICTAEGKAWRGRGEGQEVRWQTDKMWLHAIIFEMIRMWTLIFLNIQKTIPKKKWMYLQMTSF